MRGGPCSWPGCMQQLAVGRGPELLAGCALGATQGCPGLLVMSTPSLQPAPAAFMHGANQLWGVATHVYM